MITGICDYLQIWTRIHSNLKWKQILPQFITKKLFEMNSKEMKREECRLRHSLVVYHHVSIVLDHYLNHTSVQQNNPFSSPYNLTLDLSWSTSVFSFQDEVSIIKSQRTISRGERTPITGWSYSHASKEAQLLLVVFDAVGYIKPSLGEGPI